MRLLGPIEVTIDGRARLIPGVRRRTMLTVLAQHAGEAVSSPRLADIVWGDAVTTSTLVTPQSHISWLRSTLGPAVGIRCCPPGYVLVALAFEGNHSVSSLSKLGAALAELGLPERSCARIGVGGVYGVNGFVLLLPLSPRRWP